MRISGLVIAALTVMAVTGCKDKSGNDTAADAQMARGRYDVEKNAVTVVELERTDFSKQLVCNGRLEAGRRAALQFSVSGTVASVRVRDGQSVRQGDVLASLDRTQPERQLRQARLAFEKAQMALSDRLLDYGYTLSDTASIPAGQRRTIYINTGYLDAQMALEEAERVWRETELRAPFSGRVASVTGREYEPAGAFCTLIDDSRYLVRFSVLETECRFVREGQQVLVSPFVDSGTTVTGTIRSVNPTVGQNGQIAVTAQVPGSAAFMDGMNVRVIIENTVPDQLVVPKSAVVIRDNMDVLFRYVDGRSLWTYVNVLMSNTTQHVVEPNRERGATLDEGDLIVTSGNLNLGDDAPIEIVE